MSDLVMHGRSTWTDTEPGGQNNHVTMGRYTLYVHYSEGATAKTEANARQLIRNIREFHVGPQRGWDDIGYNYIGCVVNKKLHVWVGRGHLKVPAAQQGANVGNLAICFLANGQTPFDAAAVKGLAAFAVDYHAGKLAPHSHQNNTDCPGDKIRAGIPKAAKLAGIPHL